MDPAEFFPTVRIDRASPTPIYRQVEAGLRQAILSGRLRAGVRVPGMRAYARHLGVAAVTVITAYDQLVAEGFLAVRSGVGTIVADVTGHPARVATAGPRPAPRARLAPPGLPTTTRPGPRRPFFEPRATEWPPVEIDFRTGSTRLDLFPHRAWERCLRAAWRELSAEPQGIATTYLHPAGDPRLREAVAEYLGASRGVRCEPDDVVITAGAQAAMRIGVELWVVGRGPLAVEDPGGPHLFRALEAAGAELVHVPVDGRGLRLEQLPRDAAGVLVTPSWQYPAGGTMPIGRRLQLLDWAARRGAVVLEDDCDSELRYVGHPIASLQGLASQRDATVLYVGTFSKVLFPGLRTGYAVVPRPAREAFIARLEAAYRGPGALEQRTLARFIADGHFHRHLARLRTAFAERQGLALTAIDRHLGGLVEAAEAPAGAHLVVRIVEPCVTATALGRAAVSLGVAIEPLALSRSLPAADDAFVLHYARHGLGELEDGIRRLRRAFDLAATASTWTPRAASA
jgi:GntR family transcriptional regulator / MocR family aminotransferase